MRQQQTFRSFLLVLLMLIFFAFALKLPYAGGMNELTRQEFEDVLESGKVSEITIRPNAQTPTGMVIVTLENGDIVRQNVSDVKQAEELMALKNLDYFMDEVPQENYLVTILVPFMLSVAVIIVIMMVMNRNAAGGGGISERAGRGSAGTAR